MFSDMGQKKNAGPTVPATEENPRIESDDDATQRRRNRAPDSEDEYGDEMLRQMEKEEREM